ncbi:MAG TPA: PIG-L deacetylase family protein [Terriglobales bacterium]|nr:PIG-L deacetylase family protein [Terriglobales bacterium]
MLKAQLAKPAGSVRQILCLGAHCDDIEIGCGGTILRWLEEQPQTAVYWVVFSSGPGRREEAQASAMAFLQKAQCKNVMIKDFRDGFLPYVGKEVKECFEDLKQKTSPDIIFTHYRDDLHQDHRLVSELTWNTWRDHLILEYEIPKYDGDFGSPNCFVELDESLCRRKSDYLLEHFPSQRNKHWFSEETFQALLRLRGMECHSATTFAEGFYSRKLVLS